MAGTFKGIDVYYRSDLKDLYAKSQWPNKHHRQVREECLLEPIKISKRKLTPKVREKRKNTLTPTKKPLKLSYTNYFLELHRQECISLCGKPELRDREDQVIYTLEQCFLEKDNV